ncbi:FAST kinase domain-containing protein 4 isoform X4 [Struthio camelus]|uniref:FAST kinase domain-containing protein 4 isoform X4 n=1 Tax=Struthio camelus TaxID=8801 RepID=UPI003603E06B
MDVGFSAGSNPQRSCTMAARLVRHCCWRHFGAFVSTPSAVPASLLVSAGKMVIARALPQGPFTSFHASSPCSWADGFSVKEQVEDNRNPEHRVISELIETATSPQELFQLSELHSLNSNQASLVIMQLSRLAAEKKLETESILQDERFQQLVVITDSQALELAEQFNPDDIRKITLALAYQNRRSVPLLRALSYHLIQKHSELSLNVLMDLIFAYGKLNFHQPQVFQKIATDLHPHVSTMTPVEVTRCIRSFAVLKWLNLPLFEAIAQYALDNTKELSVSHVCSIILSFARLNFQPSGSEDFFSMVHEKLQDQLDSLDPLLLTDLVWSLCVLQQARAPYLQKVLAPNFHAQIRGDQSLKAQNLRLKLTHINAAARLESPDYGGPFLPAEVLSALGQAREKVTLLQSSLQEALAGVLGSKENGRFSVFTVYGWQIDAEMLVNGENKPLPLKGFCAPHLLRSEGTKPLPAGARRVAFLKWEFPNFSNRSKDLLGRYVMARRHVQAAGFLVVDVPYYELLDLKSDRQRTAYLKDKLNKAVAKEMAN